MKHFVSTVADRLEEGDTIRIPGTQRHAVVEDIVVEGHDMMQLFLDREAPDGLSYIMVPRWEPLFAHRG